MVKAAIGAERTLANHKSTVYGPFNEKRTALLAFSCDKAAESTIEWRDHSQIKCGALVCGLLKYGNAKAPFAKKGKFQPD